MKTIINRHVYDLINDHNIRLFNNSEMFTNLFRMLFIIIIIFIFGC